ncbi:hypothetical protein CVS40_6940 [Lucilia cuprina]|nr:hypothetical protein CVS40_6940 [Lucilia cuprina]
MDPLIFFIVLLVIYGVLFFLISCMHYPYDAFLKNSGLSIQFLRLKWHTTAFNRLVLRLGNSGGSCCRSCYLAVLRGCFNSIFFWCRWLILYKPFIVEEALVWPAETHLNRCRANSILENSQNTNYKF